jgi:hypothetical protein
MKKQMTKACAVLLYFLTAISSYSHDVVLDYIAARRDADRLNEVIARQKEAIKLITKKDRLSYLVNILDEKNAPILAKEAALFNLYRVSDPSVIPLLLENITLSESPTTLTLPAVLLSTYKNEAVPEILEYIEKNTGQQQVLAVKALKLIKGDGYEGFLKDRWNSLSEKSRNALTFGAVDY